MTTEITLNALTTDSVTVKTIRVFEDGGEVYRFPPHIKLYPNSVWGRKELSADLPEPYLLTALTLWGDTPTVADPVAEPLESVEDTETVSGDAEDATEE